MVAVGAGPAHRFELDTGLGGRLVPRRSLRANYLCGADPGLVGFRTAARTG